MLCASIRSLSLALGLRQGLPNPEAVRRKFHRLKRCFTNRPTKASIIGLLARGSKADHEACCVCKPDLSLIAALIPECRMRAPKNSSSLADALLSPCHASCNLKIRSTDITRFLAFCRKDLTVDALWLLHLLQSGYDSRAGGIHH